MVWRQPVCRAFGVASCPPDSRAVPGSCRQPPVPGPTSDRSRGRSITLAGTRCRPSVFSMPERGCTPYAWRRLPSAATVTGQLGPDRRRTTHPRSPARAHHRAGLGGTGPSERTLQDDAEAGVHRLFIPPIRIEPFLAWCAEQSRAPANARAGYSASLARRQDPALIAAWPPSTRDPTPMPSMSSALNPPMGNCVARRTSDGRRTCRGCPPGG